MMRKKKLINEINGVVARNNELFSKCRELESSIDAKDTLINSLKLQVEELKAENEILRSEYFSPKPTTVNECIEEDTVIIKNDVDDIETNEVFSQSANTFVSDESVKETLEFKPIFNESVLKISSSAIGSVVLKCAELCNTFANENNINSKDLINLALGRTEVFKSEVLQLASQEMSEELLLAELKLKETEILEYFELLLRQ